MLNANAAFASHRIESSANRVRCSLAINRVWLGERERARAR